MNKNIFKTLPAAVAFALTFSQAYAGDAEGIYNGYFRAGAGSNSSNGSQACFGLPTAGGKYRLGNECDFYGEFGYTKEVAKSANGASFVGTVMANVFSPNIQPPGLTAPDKLGLAQMFVEAKNVDFLNGGTAWVGQRYYNRPDLHMLDFKYLQGDGLGGGIDALPLGPGKFSYGIFRNDIANLGDKSSAGTILPANNSATRHNFTYKGLPTNPNGSLQLDASVVRADSAKTIATHNGWALSAIHTQAKVLGGDNTLGLQYAVGASVGGNGINSTGDSTNGSDVTRTRVFDQLYWQVTPEFGGALVFVAQRDKGDAAGKAQKWYSIGARPVYALNENFKLQLEVGHDRVTPEGGKTQQLTKITFAPTIAAGKGFWSRPELRAFVTHARWNDAAQAASAAGTPMSSTGVFGGSTKGTSIGLQVETWW